MVGVRNISDFLDDDVILADFDDLILKWQFFVEEAD